MKSVIIRRFGGPEVLELVETAPATPAAGEVLVRAEAFGVGRPDALMRRGVYQWSPPLPFSPGNHLAGAVEQLGPGVTALAVGARVLVSARDLPRRGGCYTEKLCVAADRVHPLPASVSFEDAVCLANYEVAAAILGDMIGPRIPRRALVIGAAGGVGSALVQLAKRNGMTVIGTVSTDTKARFALSMGADHVINWKAGALHEQVMALTAGAGADLVLDHVGGPTLLQYPALLAPWGTIVSYGALAGEPGGDLFVALRANVGKSPSLRCFSMHSYDDDAPGRRDILTQMIALLARGEIRPAIARPFALGEMAAAHALLDSGAACGRIVAHP